MFPLISVAILGLTGAAWVKARNRGKMTPRRQAIFDAAMSELKDSNKLRELADSYEKEGLPAQAILLRKRAGLRDLSPEVKKQRKAVFEKAMESTDANYVREIAKAFHREGAIGAAEDLRMHAEMLALLPPETTAQVLPEEDVSVPDPELIDLNDKPTTEELIIEEPIPKEKATNEQSSVSVESGEGSSGPVEGGGPECDGDNRTDSEERPEGSTES